MKLFFTQSGFTLIETLVAIAILMVAISGPLDIANKGLVAAVNSRDQTIATYLAEDTMEFVKNVRDYNILNSKNWLTSLDNGNIQCISIDPCIINTATDNVDNPSVGNDSNCTFSGNPVTLSSGCQLYIDGNSGYYKYISTPGPGDQPTPFYRSFYITPFGTPTNSALLTVSVYWTSGTLLNKVILQSMIFNTTR